MITQVAQPLSDLAGLANVYQQEDTDLLSRPVVSTQHEAHEHPVAQEPVDLTDEVAHQGRNEAQADGNDERLIHQVGERAASDGEKRQADPHQHDRQPHETACDEHHEKRSLPPTTGNEPDHPAHFEAHEPNGHEQPDHASCRQGRARVAADQPAEP